jgi:hypothetical protein
MVSSADGAGSVIPATWARAKKWVWPFCCSTSRMGLCSQHGKLQAELCANGSRMQAVSVAGQLTGCSAGLLLLFINSACARSADSDSINLVSVSGSYHLLGTCNCQERR